MVAGKIDVGGSKRCGWLWWDRELESDGWEHGEDVGVVGGDAGGIVKRGDSADGHGGVVG